MHGQDDDRAGPPDDHVGAETTRVADVPAAGPAGSSSPAPQPPERATAPEPPGPAGPTLPASEARRPVPMVDPVTTRPAVSAGWYRTDEDRARSVYRRANPWYRRVARGFIMLAFLAVAAVGAYAAARAVQHYLDRDRLPAAGADVPDIRASSFLITSTAPAPAVDGTLTIDTGTLAFEFVGRATGPQSGLQVVSPDGTTVYVRDGAAPWRAATAGDATAAAVRTAVHYLADDDTADDVLTNRLRRGFVDLLAEVEEGRGEHGLTRYEMSFDTAALARDFPLQWRSFQDEAVPGAVADDAAPVTIWLDAESVLMRVDDRSANWVWERLTYSDQPFQPIDPAEEAATRIVQVACVSADNSLFWQTPLASCDAALAAAEDAAVAAGIAAAFDDLDRSVAQLCSTMEREAGPVPATAGEAYLAGVLVEAGVCRGDPTIFAAG